MSVVGNKTIVPMHEDQWMRIEAHCCAKGNNPGIVVLWETNYVLGADGLDGSHFDYEARFSGNET